MPSYVVKNAPAWKDERGYAWCMGGADKMGW